MNLVLILVPLFGAVVPAIIQDHVVWPNYKSPDVQDVVVVADSSNSFVTSSDKSYPAIAQWQNLQKHKNKDILPVYKEEIPKPYKSSNKEYIPLFASNTYIGRGRSLGSATSINRPVIWGTKHVFYSAGPNPIDVIELECKNHPNQLIKWYKTDEKGINGLMVADGDHVVFQDNHYVIQVDATHSRLIIYEPYKEHRAGFYTCSSQGTKSPLQTFRVFS